MNKDLIRKQIMYSHLKLFILYKRLAMEAKKNNAFNEERSCLTESKKNYEFANLFCLNEEYLDFDPFITDAYYLRLYQLSEECIDFIDDFNNVLKSLKEISNV